MEVEGMGGMEGESGRHAWGRGTDCAGPQGDHMEEAGSEGQSGKEMRNHMAVVGAGSCCVGGFLTA